VGDYLDPGFLAVQYIYTCILGGVEIVTNLSAAGQNLSKRGEYCFYSQVKYTTHIDVVAYLGYGK
jgi:hypothetical protein